MKISSIYQGANVQYKAFQPSYKANSPAFGAINKCELPYNMPRTEGKIGDVTVTVAGAI